MGRGRAARPRRSPVAKGEDRAAAAAFVSYWLGRWRWWLSPERFKIAIAATIPKVALEFTIAIDAPTSLQDYAEVTAPTLLIKGSKTRAPTRAVVDLLGATLPNATLERFVFGSPKFGRFRKLNASNRNST